MTDSSMASDAWTVKVLDSVAIGSSGGNAGGGGGNAGGNSGDDNGGGGDDNGGGGDDNGSGRRRGFGRARKDGGQ